MFSANGNEGGHGMATRSRRRLRPRSSENLTQQPKAKRQRLPLTEQTFVNPEQPQEPSQPEPTPEPEEEPTPKKAGRTSRRVSRIEDVENEHAPRRDSLNVRARKTKHGDRAANKGDGSLVLTSTNAYTVSKLPALPDRIRSDWSTNQHGEIVSSFGYALAMTSSHAIVWPYTSTSQSPETFTFNLPPPSKPSDPLPVGCLVSPSASSSEPGLVIIMAGSGRVVYWESISSAATFAFMKRDRSGVEYTISGMTSGEKVVDITNAESAGFVLSFNTGRLAYLNVRDNHGRPAISVQFLRSGMANAGAGFFGSIRHAFSNLSLRGDIAAVRADRSTRVGEKNIVALGTKGRLQAWKIHRGGHNEALGESDIREDILAALHDTDPKSQDFPEDSFEALDFTFVPKGLEDKYFELSRLSQAMASDDPSIQHLVVLVGLTKKRTSRYALVEVILTRNGGQVGMVRPITSYSTPFAQSDVAQTTRPRVYLPRPALVAFVVFDRAAIVASIAIPPESPDAQLQSDNHMVPPSFEDVVDFREDSVHEILGSGFEEAPLATSQERYKTKNPAAILLVRGVGVIRLVTTDVDQFAGDQPPAVTAKSKLEQAVFFGVKQDNPLIFDKRQEIEFLDEEVGRAALEVSNEILSSTTSFLSTLPAHLEDNLRARSYALERLMEHLRATGANLDRATRWELLHNAEKMHVATLLWKRHEQFTAFRSADDKKSLIAYIVDFIHEEQKHKPSAKAGEVDSVRHWFINDIYRLDIFVAWAYEVIKVLYKDRLLDDAKVTVMLYESMQVYICTHLGAMDFRKSNLAFYELGSEKLHNGILTTGYEGLPEPWTATQYVANNAKRLVELSQQWIDTHYFPAQKPAKTAATPDRKILEKLFQDLPTLTDGVLTILHEFARYARSAADAQTRRSGQDFAEQYHSDRLSRPIYLAEVGHWEAAAKIAKKHGCLKGLAQILLKHIEKLEVESSQQGISPADLRSFKSQLDAKKTELENYLESYGKEFAFPLYDYILEKAGVSAVLDFELDKHNFKTQYLRSKPTLAKISWINDIQLEDDVSHAANTLVSLGLYREEQVWSKKIELSLGKLALLAEAEDKSNATDALKVKADEAKRDESLAQVDKELIVIKIQDQLYSHVLPSTFDAVDEAAASNIAIEAHGANIPRRQKVVRQIFEQGMERLMKHEVLDPMTLIELLTLVFVRPENGVDMLFDPFWMALKVADTCCNGDQLKEAKKLIWRRLFTRDDWSKINDTKLKDDEEVSLTLADTALFSTLVECIRREDAREPFQPRPPQDALGAFTEEVDTRFSQFDADFHKKLKDEMKGEDKTLKQYIDRAQLSKWLRTTFEIAHVQLEADVDAATQADLMAVDGVPGDLILDSA